MTAMDAEGLAKHASFVLTWASDVADKMRDLVRSKQLLETSNPERYPVGTVITGSDGTRYRITRHRHVGVEDLGVISAPRTIVYGTEEINDRLE